MRKTLILTAVLLLSLGNGLAAQEKPRLEISSAFATAQEAANFANSLPEEIRSEVQFVCEYRQGAPMGSFYKVVYHANAKFYTSPLAWSFKEFATPEEAVAFVNENQVYPKYTACWNPNLKPAGTDVTVFYHPVKRATRYEQEAYGPFASAETAASWANKTTPLHSVQFLATLDIARQVQARWYVITGKGLPSYRDSANESWVAYQEAPDTEEALRIVNGSGLVPHSRIMAIEHIGLVPNLTTWNTRSGITVFLLAETAKLGGLNQNSLTIPVQVFATGTLLEQVGTERIKRAVSIAKASLRMQTENAVGLEVEPDIQTAPDINSPNPNVLGINLPRQPNTLAIIFTDRPIKDPHGTIEAAGKSVAEWVGQGWIVVWLYPPLADALPPEKRLLHGLGHILGTGHSANPNSVMCSAFFTENCSRNSLWLDPTSKQNILDGIKTIRRIGLDTYLGLRYR